MNEKLTKPYSPMETEGRIYKLWEESGFFNPEKCIEAGHTAPDAEPFTIALPPPNVTGILHMGSALMVVNEDIMIRHARMRGRRTLWIPGTDSAAIATQSKVEKEIQKKEKKNRYDLGREELLRRIDEFVEENKSTILSQMRVMGASLDWSRYAYTMDEKRYRAVMEAFVRMHKAGLIYRGNRIVNWDPKGATVISDDEIVHEERDANMYTFRYWKDFPIAISTTRPETKVGDTAVAVHPDDARYSQYVGQEFTGEFAGKSLTIKVVADRSVEPDFGTGALGVTPAHAQTDWEIAERHDLARPQVIDERARMTEEAGPMVAGLKVGEAREKIVEWLTTEDLLEKSEAIKQNVSTAERTGGIVEPLPKLQWFIAVDKPFAMERSNIPGIAPGAEMTLKEIMRTAVSSGAIKILPERFEQVYSHWIENLRPWCISRQIWFGHRIPVWYHKTCQNPGNAKQEEPWTGQMEPVVSIDRPTLCPRCGADNLDAERWEQDEDVLDTWFSSALWTFSTLGWPDETEDLKLYHPTTILETGYDIIFFWVARMVLMSGFHLGEVPFKTVYLHGLVRAGDGKKISKSLGNNIDPVEMGKKYGIDAIRMALVVGTGPGADSRVSEEKFKAYKHFANKLWNITRFVLDNTSLDSGAVATPLTQADTLVLARLQEMVRETSAQMEKYQFHLAAEGLYHYVWHEFADKYIEEVKGRLREAGSPPTCSDGSAGQAVDEKLSAEYTLRAILETSVKLLHPFMPFVTEEIWQIIHKGESMLMVTPWPRS